MTVTQLLRHGAKVHADRSVVTWQGESARRVTFADTYDRIEQLAFVIRDGGDKAIIVDDSLVPLLAQVKDELTDVEHIIVVGDGDTDALEREVVRYDDLLADQTAGYDWPEVDENDPVMMCYTSGTTDNPKGVVYSHRSQWTHTMGADILQPGPFLQPEPLTAFIAAEKPNFSAAVPTVWNGVLALGQETELDLSSLQRVVVVGAAVPRSMIVAFKEQYDIDIVQGWGMTEMSPLGTLAIPPHEIPTDDVELQADWRAKTGRIVPGVDMRIIGEDGTEQPWDGKAVGEVEVRGPWITAGYHDTDTHEKFSDDGWLRTGDVAVIEAAVIGVPEEKWSERPLACVVVKEGAELTPQGLSEYLQDQVAKWWIPERWSFIDEVPKTSVGKYDKKVLRSRHEHGDLQVQTMD